MTAKSDSEQDDRAVADGFAENLIGALGGADWLGRHDAVLDALKTVGIDAASYRVGRGEATYEIELASYNGPLDWVAELYIRWARDAEGWSWVPCVLDPETGQLNILEPRPLGVASDAEPAEVAAAVRRLLDEGEPEVSQS